MRASLALALIAAPAVVAAQPTEKQPLPHAAARPDPYDQFTPTVVAGDGGYLMAWSTERGFGHVSRVMATRLDASGEVIDRIAIDLGARVTSVSGDDRITAAWDGDGYTVLWINGIGNVEARRVHDDGTLGPLMIVSPFLPAVEQRWPSLACGDGHCLAAWWRFESGVGHAVRLARLAGDTIVATQLPVTAATGDQHEPAVAWSGDEYLVVWRDIRRPGGGDLYGARVSAAGAMLDPQGFVISAADGTEDQAAVTWTESAFQIVWRDDRSGSVELRGARVTSGNVVPAGGLHVADGPIANPAIAWSGQEHLVTWTDGGVRAIRLDQVGTPLASASSPWSNVPGATRATVARRAAGGFVVGLRERRAPDAGDTDALLAIVSPGASAAGPPWWISGVDSTEAEPVISASGDGFLAAWADHRSGQPVIRAARLGLDGASRDDDGFAISPPGQTADELLVAGGAGQSLVIWVRRPAGQATEHIEAARVDAAGNLLDAAPITVSPTLPFYHRAFPDAVWNGESYTIVWTDTEDRAVGARVSAAGELLDAGPFPISRSANRASGATISWSGSVHLVVWQSAEGIQSYIAAARLDRAGALLDGADLTLGTRIGNPAVAGGPRGFLVLWDGDTAGQRYDTAGQPLGAPLPDLNLPAPTKLVWDGASWIGLGTRVDSGSTVYVASRYLHDGTRTETLDIGASTSLGRAAVASAGAGRAAFVFTERVDSPYDLHDVDHLWTRAWSSDLTLPPETPDAGPDAMPGGDGGGSGGCASGGAASPLLGLLLVARLARRRYRIS